MPTASAASDMPDSLISETCLFYLELQGQLLIPASTIQTIVEEMHNVHELGQAYMITQVSSSLKNDMSLSDEAVTKICDCIKEPDLFSACHQGIRDNLDIHMMFLGFPLQKCRCVVR